MVKMQAVQSALAIRRQRSRREAKKAKGRRESRASVLSTPRPSVVSLDGRVYFHENGQNKKVFGQVTMFHVGGVLILIGLFLVLTSLMPEYIRTTSPQRRSDLLGTGSFFVFIGGLLTTISRFVSNNEEEELNKYIRGRLSKGRSCQKIVKDVESGCATPVKERKHKPATNGVGLNGNDESGEFTNLCVITDEVGKTESIASSSEVPPECMAVGVESPMTPSASTEPVLSKIIEEDEMDLESDATTEPIESSTPETSLSPTSPLETQGLLGKRCSGLGSKGPTKNIRKAS